jgi:hypothetical protein
MCLVLSSITIPSSLFNFSIYAQQGGAATSGPATDGAAIGGAAPCYGSTCNYYKYDGPATSGAATGPENTSGPTTGASETPSSPKTPNGLSIYSSREFGIWKDYPSS